MSNENVWYTGHGLWRWYVDEHHNGYAWTKWGAKRKYRGAGS